MQERPIKPKESIFNRLMLREVLISGITIGMIVFILWLFLSNSDMNIMKARGYVMTLMVFIQNIHVLNCRSEKKSVFTNGFKKNPFVLFTITGSILLQIIVMEVPFLSEQLKTFSLGFLEMVILFVIAMSILPVIEIYKHLNASSLTLLS